MNFLLRDIKKYSVSELYRFRGMAMLSQGNGCTFSRKIENRIDKIKAELEKRGEVVEY